MDELFEPVTVGKLELPSRLVMAPMTRSRAFEDGKVTESTVEYYRQRAGAGLIVTEAVQPSVRGQGYMWTPGLHAGEQVTAWRAVTDAVHAEGGRIYAQLMHSGRVGHPVLYPDGGLPVGASPIASGDQMFHPDGMLDHPEPRELTRDGIAEAVADFAAAARNAVEAGFDGVEIHGANGYLIHQFLGDGSNVRTDEYGGSVENRIRFGVEVAQAVADAIGPERTGFRVSPGNGAGGVTESDVPESYGALVAALAPLGLAYLHVMEMGNRDVTRQIRDGWPGVLVVNPHPVADGSPSNLADGVAALRDGVADAIAFGQLWLANPDLPERIKAGGPYNAADPASFYGGDQRGYTDYPVLDA